VSSFEPSAALARVVAALPGGGEARPGQAEMAAAVASAIAEERHVVVQAGTGTGKSLAYLVPAILSGKKVVVATATKALQDQLATKDLPFLAKHLEVPFEFAVLKGRSNYLCRQRAREVISEGEQLDLDDAPNETPSLLARQVRRLVEWGKETESGDRAELDFEPRPLAWSSVSVSAMECPGAAKCPAGDECLAEAARQRAEHADVVVVNTHLYGAHLASGGHVLPEHDVVVFDEAHQLEDIASSSLGFELGAGRFKALARTIRGLVDDGAVVDALDDAGYKFEAAIAPFRGQRLPEGLGPELGAAMAMIEERVRKANAAVRAATGPDEARKNRAMQAGGHLQGDLAVAIAASGDDVVWIEGPPDNPVLKLAPLAVGPVLAAKLWDEVTAVLTSATIPLALGERLGLPSDNHVALDVGSPFDFEEHGLLYCAAHLPDPRTAGFDAAVHEELEALINAAGGRTLALFTSWRAMQAAADALTPKLAFRVLTQADLPKPALLAAFTSDETSCLFATMGFWQGVDVPGPALSLVTIDKLPFPRPDEPLLQARRQVARAAAFRTIDLPRAVTMLAQGAGRLIRSATDRGVVAVFDPRLAKAGYRWDVVKALPPMRRTKERSEVEAFLRSLTVTA